MSNLVFTPETHEYRVNGKLIPSVTQVLQGAGLIDFSKVPMAQLEASRAFGVAVHKATELYDRGVLDDKSLDANLRPYLESWQLFRQEYGFEPEYTEKPMYSKVYGFAGTPDRIGKRRRDNDYIILDIKTSSSFMPVTAIQLSAYELLFRGQIDKKHKIRRLAILLNAEGKYKLENYKDKGDVNVFISALNIWKWKNRNNVDNSK